MCRGIQSRENRGDADTAPSGSLRSGKGDLSGYSLHTGELYPAESSSPQEGLEIRRLGLRMEGCLNSHCYQMPHKCPASFPRLAAVADHGLPGPLVRFHSTLTPTLHRPRIVLLKDLKDEAQLLEYV